jgi:hypothetical protein
MMMMVGTILGPGTIFLMLSGATAIALSMDDWVSFLVNLIPILGFMFACYALSSKVQIFLAQILSAIYALLMMAVLVGIMLQVKSVIFELFIQNIKEEVLCRKIIRLFCTFRSTRMVCWRQQLCRSSSSSGLFS